MSTPQSTPVKHVRLGLVSAKSSPLTNEFKRLLCDQHQRLSMKHQQDLDLLDDIRSYVKARLSIEKEYTNALQKLAKHHSSHIQKKFQLLHQLDREPSEQNANSSGGAGGASNQQAGTTDGAKTTINGLGNGPDQMAKHQHQTEQGQQQQQQPSKPSSLYRVWWDHVNCLQSTARNRAEQFEQSNLIVDKLKDIRQHKAAIGKKCLETHLRRIQEDILASMLDVDKAKKLYHEDESQAKKARENEERIKKKRSGLLTKFTDLQAKKEKSSAQREATDIQSTQARNDYIMALAAANSHLNYYYYRDLKDFIHLIDDGVLDHCKIFMATLGECDINSLKDSLSHAQYWSRLINLTGSQQTNQIFIDCEQSKCLKEKRELQFEACNNDPIQKISLEHNADYALQHEIDKWFTWFKKECRNLSQLMHQLDTCQQAVAEGRKSIELNGQTIDDLEPKIIDLKQQIRKCEAAKLRAQARLMVIKEGGMQIEEWSTVELEIRADMARAQEEQERPRRVEETASSQDGRATGVSFDEPGLSSGSPTAVGATTGPTTTTEQGACFGPSNSIHLQVSRDSDDSDTQAGDGGGGGGGSMHNLASVSRSTSNLMQKQQQALSGYSALTDPSLVWQDDYSAAWAGGSTTGNANQEGDHQTGGQGEQPMTTIKSPTSPRPSDFGSGEPLGGREASGYDLLKAQQTDQQGDVGQKQQQQQHIPNASMSIQSSSPLSAIVNGGQHLSQSPYQGAMSEAYKSDYECDYTRIGQHSIRSAASSVEPSSSNNNNNNNNNNKQHRESNAEQLDSVAKMLNRQVIALYKFEKNNHDDLEFDEHDLLEVIEVNADDTNWVKARHLTNGREGYIPSSYVRLYDEGGCEPEQPRRQSSAWSASGGDQQQQQQQEASQQAWAAQDDFGSGAGDAAAADGVSYCRALYDYAPDGDAVDEVDGLPHLALKQGDLCRIIDQGEDDGWWLVEKDESGVRGHVPSMLVEEVEPGEEEDDEIDDGDVTDDDDDGENAANDDGDEHVFQEPPPNFEPPVLELDTGGDGDGNGADDGSAAGSGASAGDAVSTEQPAAPTGPEHTSDSLIPKSFIIIEPTPEVESKRFEDDLQDGDAGADSAVSDEMEPEVGAAQKGSARPVVQSQPPASSGSYSVYNEDFVLEKPSRKANANANATVPDQHHHQHHHHSQSGSGFQHEPTIVEEEDVQAGLNQAETVGATSSTNDDKRYCDDDGGDGDEEFEFDSNRPAPPSVVIDSVEAIPRSPDLSLDEGQGAEEEEEEERQSEHSDLSQGATSTASSGAERKSTTPRHYTNFADVSPILRHHADEFTKQLIEEAILLAPGSRIGPSTSSADMTNDDDEMDGLERENGDNNSTKLDALRPANGHTYDHHNSNHRGDDDDDDDDDDV